MKKLLAAVLLAAAAPAAAAPRLSSAAAVQLDEGLRRLYALDYGPAQAAFHRVIELNPDGPFGYLFESGGLWWQASQEPGLFQARPDLERVFTADVAAALERARPKLAASDPNVRAEGYFASGMALGTRGQWDLLRHHYLDAYFDGRRAVKDLRRCLALDGDYLEADLGLGIYDYEAAHLSGVARLGFILGVRGNETRGLKLMTIAMQGSRYARRQAAEFLATIYLSDLHDPERALPIVRYLRQDDPDGPYFLFMEALARHRLGDEEGSRSLGRRLAGLAAADPGAFAPKWLSLVCGLSEPDCLRRGDVAETLDWLDGALAAPANGPSGPADGVLRLLRAHALDALGRRAQAQSEYRRVIDGPAPDAFRRRARACLRSPCTREALLLWMRAQAGLDSKT